jgi:hypothetical protein
MSAFGRLAKWYFTPRPWETKRAFEALGTRAFKTVLLALARPIVGRRRIARPNWYFAWDFTRAGLERLERMTRIVEVYHLAWLLFTGFAAVGCILAVRPCLAGIMGVLALLNGQCVLLQRYHRVRLLSTLARKRS